MAGNSPRCVSSWVKENLPLIGCMLPPRGRTSSLLVSHLCLPLGEMHPLSKGVGAKHSCTLGVWSLTF